MSAFLKDDGTINRILWLVVTGIVFTLVTALIQILAPKYFKTKTEIDVTCKCNHGEEKGEVEAAIN